MVLVKKIISILTNRYVLTSIVFMVLIFGFGPNNLMVQHRLNNKLEKVETEKKFYLKEIEKDRNISKVLMTNKDNLERFAREHYWMKRDNEDVYLVIREDGETKTKKK